MNLSDLGFTEEFREYTRDLDPAEFSVGRVTQEHRERYAVSDGETEYEAEVTGNLRYSASSRSDFPAVGDWVVMKTYKPDQAIIHRVLPRRSLLARQSVSKTGEIQVISANIDVAFIVQSIGNNFSINRLERYLAICYQAGIEPVMVISKTDLSSEAEIAEAVSSLAKRESKVKFILLSNKTLNGLDQVLGYIRKGKTYCVVGSSGVGKSTLINNLLKKDILRTGEISHSTSKGRHITEHRELFVLENGGIIIDTPGMKELGMTGNSEGVSITFRDIGEIAMKCRFTDCTHTSEAGCAVMEALEKGIIDKDSFDNFCRLRKEQERFQTTVAEKRRKEKVFGRMLKNYHRDIRKNDESG